MSRVSVGKVFWFGLWSMNESWQNTEDTMELSFFTSKFVLTVFLRTLFCSDRLPSPHFESDWDFRLLLQVVSDCWRRMVSSMTCPKDFEKLLRWLSIFEKTRFKFKGTLFWGKDAHVQRLKMFHRVGAVTQPSWFHGGKIIVSLYAFLLRVSMFASFRVYGSFNPILIFTPFWDAMPKPNSLKA